MSANSQENKSSDSSDIHLEQEIVKFCPEEVELSRQTLLSKLSFDRQAADTSLLKYLHEEAKYGIINSPLIDPGEMDECIDLERKSKQLEIDIKQAKEKIRRKRKQKLQRQAKNKGQREGVDEIKNIFNSVEFQEREKFNPEIKHEGEEEKMRSKEEALKKVKKYLINRIEEEKQQCENDRLKLEDIRRKKQSYQSSLKNLLQEKRQKESERNQKLMKERISMEEESISQLQKCIQKLRRR